MMQKIIFSRDRPAQLDLLLRSIQRNCHVEGPTRVIYRTTSHDMMYGYGIVAGLHRYIEWYLEHDCSEFKDLTVAAVRPDVQLTMLFSDDNLLRHPIRPTDKQFSDLIDREDVECISTRVGLNTVRCGVVNLPQATPDDLHTGLYKWRGAHGDYGYPLTTDGDIWRTPHLLPKVVNTRYDGPNKLELALSDGGEILPLLACYTESRLIAIANNRVQDVFENFSFGGDPVEINNRWLGGGKLSLESHLAQSHDACHYNGELIWE